MCCKHFSKCHFVLFLVKEKSHRFLETFIFITIMMQNFPRFHRIDRFHPALSMRFLREGVA